MYCYKKVTNDLLWVGGNDYRIGMFESIYPVPNGVSYNSYLLMDEKTVLFDTVDTAISKVFFENLAHVLGERTLDYLIIHHMEPDHSSTMQEVVLKYPSAKIVCNAKTVTMIKQFFDLDVEQRVIVLKEGDTISTGHHNLKFMMAPMVHWPEVMVSYDTTDKILFSADAFGCFGTLQGAIFADEVDFERDFMDEARRYYANIIGKYGAQVQALLKKLSQYDINMICPLHGFVWRKEVDYYISKYQQWSTYTPEEKGVMIAYASIYGNTANAAEIIASHLRDLGIRTEIFDVSKKHLSEILAASFKWSHMVLASATYNSRIFVTMENLIFEMVTHNLQNRTVGIIENGTWAPTSAKLIRAEMEKCNNMNILKTSVSIKSSMKEEQLGELNKLVQDIVDSLS